MKPLWKLIKQTFVEWDEDNAPRLAAALSYYTVFSLAPLLVQLVNVVVSFAVITLLFAIIFKFVPDVKIKWHDVWIGAAVTALLFNIGKFLIGLYLGRSSVTSTYGAAGSLVIILLWVLSKLNFSIFNNLLPIDHHVRRLQNPSRKNFRNFASARQAAKTEMRRAEHFFILKLRVA